MTTPIRPKTSMFDLQESKQQPAAHTEAQTTAATTSDPTMQILRCAAPITALPASISLKDLANLSNVMSTPPSFPPSREEIREAKEAGNFLRLKELLEQTIAYEYNQGSYDLSNRDFFMNSFTELQTELNRSLKHIMDPELLKFAAEGKGGESIRVYAKVVLPLSYTDEKYGSKIMEFAKNSMSIQPNEIIPGTNQIARDKMSILLAEPLQIEGQTAREEALYRESIQQIEKASETLAKLYPEKPATETFIRGMIGSGKTTFVEERIRLKESDLCNTDAIREKLGGNLFHNRAAQINDRFKLIEVKHKIEVKTNTRDRDNELILKPPKQDGLTRIIYDLSIPLEVAITRIEDRAAHQGGRRASREEVQKGYEESVRNRAALIAGAKTHLWLEWHLFDNSDKLAEVVSIVHGSIKIFDNERLNQMRKADPLLDEALAKNFETLPT